MIKTIIFDMGKVIIPFDFKRGYDRMAAHCSYPADQIPERIRSCDLVARLESGQLEPEQFFAQFRDLLELNLNYEEFRQIFSSIFLPEPLVPESLLAGLRRSYRLVLLSNTNALHYEVVSREYPILQQFHQHVLSHVVGALKPSPKMYAAAVEAAGCSPQECFFTDDIPDYVEGARAFGIDAVQFQNADQIQRELRARGVEW